MKLKLGNLVIKYNDIPFLGPIETTFESGRINLIIGKSGCGKSTLLKVLAGFHTDYTGAMTLEDDYFNPEGNVALAFQNPESLFFNSTVFDEISYSLSSIGEKKDTIIKNTYEWMKKWGLEPDLFCLKYPFKLSGGEKRRVALAACTILKPKVILLDEPLAGLDSHGQSDLSHIINSLTDDHIVIVVTHEPELLIEKGCNILFLDGQNTMEYSYDNFLSNAIINPDFYPLPQWYCEALKPYADYIDLPNFNDDAVVKFLELVKNESTDN